ncbi:MAG: type II toxin-antitoxin system prevent-host-death family antitoxin, partial [Betaproteobacteria bacterium]|nr:type II toxin-antitoxin system prevent-host-death family antitoxin [Betaproteobacteria bacterium]
MAAVTLADAKAHLSELVSKAESGVETTITRRG